MNGSYSVFTQRLDLLIYVVNEMKSLRPRPEHIAHVFTAPQFCSMSHKIETSYYPYVGGSKA